MDKKDFEKVYNDYLHQGEGQAQFEVDHEVNSGAEQIVAVRKNNDGDLIAFKTSSGRELDYMAALSEAKSGKLAHVDVFHKYGRDIIRSEPDGIKENNLDNLPSF
ncbi:DUF3892 domain-containing protein [Bacillus wiedmannii]|uniref:DUF3892 domain-containing protein n=1 Tax=Bacillus TaxID=1386 RepID=UPI000B51B1B7|nr:MULTISPECIES: DUF3892 domain-containing protein [Bacillus]MCU5683404.1 DUF3892 domain-containing protein [Bacillus wiedmannii]OWT50180.1 hypothetical protein CER22_16730 [Bacillus sp. K2I17]PHE95493.1 DUF3892 domain-containing protein [Bacillus wiedmannii]TKH26663.1 DUF3892 domain-containing protein [Bacillus wiedmannii]